MIEYVVMNIEEKIKFEKKHHLPYGYAECDFFDTQEKAVAFVDFHPIKYRDMLVVEKIENSVGEIVYRGAWYDESIDRYAAERVLH